MSPIKVQYPVALPPDAKCPNCGKPITSIGPNLYACYSGHVLEALVLVTVKSKQQDAVVEKRLDKENGTSKAKEYDGNTRIGDLKPAPTSGKPQ